MSFATPKGGSNNARVKVGWYSDDIKVPTPPAVSTLVDHLDLKDAAEVTDTTWPCAASGDFADETVGRRPPAVPPATEATVNGLWLFWRAAEDPAGDINGQ